LVREHQPVKLWQRRRKYHAARKLKYRERTDSKHKEGD
jgi:hypothetical protein